MSSYLCDLLNDWRGSACGGSSPPMYGYVRVNFSLYQLLLHLETLSKNDTCLKKSQTVADVLLFSTPTPTQIKPSVRNVDFASVPNVVKMTLVSNFN